MVSTDPSEHNRLIYILTGTVILTILNIVNLPPLGDKFPFGNIGGLINTIILTYVTLRYRILDLNLVARRILLYASMIAIVLAVYSFWFLLIHQVFGFTLSFTSAILILLFSTLTAAIFWVQLSTLLQNKIDALFYGGRYNHRQELSDFVRSKIRGILSLKDLSEGLLPPLINVVGSRQAYMLLAEAISGDFVVELSEPPTQKDLTLRIKRNSPVVEWLRHENRYLTRESINTLPEFRGLWKEELDNIKILA
jgi:hypothetical protein